MHLWQSLATENAPAVQIRLFGKEIVYILLSAGAKLRGVTEYGVIGFVNVVINLKCVVRAVFAGFRRAIDAIRRAAFRGVLFLEIVKVAERRHL